MYSSGLHGIISIIFFGIHFLVISVSTFSALRQGIHDLRVWPGIEADGNEPTKTPGKQGAASEETMDRLAKVLFY